MSSTQSAPTSAWRDSRWSSTTLRALLEGVRANPQGLRALVAAAQGAVVAFDLGRRITCANRQAEAYFGYGPGELDHRSVDDLVPARLRQKGAPPPAVIPDVMNVELPGLHRDGRELPSEWALCATELPEGPVFITAVRDVLEAERALESLRQSEERFRLIVEGVHDCAIFMLDPRGDVVTWNAGAARINGYPAQEILGEHFSRFYTEEARANGEPARILATALAEGRCEIEGWRVRRDRSQFWASATLNRLDDPAGRHLGFVKITRDLTDRRRADENLRRLFEERIAREAAVQAEAAAQEQSRQAQVLAEASHFFARSDLDPEAVYDELAWRAARLTGDCCSVLVPLPDGQVELRAARHGAPEIQAATDRLRKVRVTPGALTAQVLRSGRSLLAPVVDPAHHRAASSPAFQEALAHHPVHSMLAVPLKAGDAVTAVVVLSRHLPDWPFSERDLRLVEDLRDRVHQALENARLYRELRKSLRSRDDLLALVSHDLRNMLSGILGNAHLISRAASHPEKVAGLGQRIERIGARMNRLLQDLLDRAQIEAGGQLSVSLAPVRVGELVQEAAEGFKAQATERGIWLETSGSDDACEVACDADRIQQVLSNLLGNALRYTPLNGTIALSACRKGAEVVFEVADTGPGIAPDLLPRVFEPYWQGEHSGGLGLGLAVCRSIVQAHGGRIRVESALGEGAHFFVHLRASEATPLRA